MCDFGFVIVRHVNNEMTNRYWQEAYSCIRKWYQEPILIVDDNSKVEYLTHREDLINCQIVNTEYPAVGEMLGYYYFHKIKPFNRACIIHDSVFFNQKVDFTSRFAQQVQFLWSFEHTWDNDIETLDIIRRFNLSSELEKFYLNKNNWLGCFGIMSVITWNLLDKINTRHNLFDTVVKNISTRSQRMLMERIFACMCFMNESNLTIRNNSKFGNIFNYCPWGLTFDDYLSDKYKNLPITKVWTGR